MGSRLRSLCGALAVAVLVLALSASLASADVEIGSKGSGAGQMLEPRGVAVDSSEGLLYVSDNGNNRIDVFDADSGEFIRAFGWGVADGTTEALQVCTTTCFKGIEGSGAGQFDGLRGIAVDNDSSSPAFHDVYVVENDNRRVQRFTSAGAFVWMVGDGVNKTTSGDLCTASSGNTCGAGTQGEGGGQLNSILAAGVAVGPGGVIHVVDKVGSGASANSRVQRYEPSGAYAGQLLLAVSGGAGESTGFAVDSTGSFYIATCCGTGAVRKYDPSGAELFRRMPSFNVNGLGVDAADNLFVSENVASNVSGSVALSGVYEFNSAGTQIRTFYSSSRWRFLGFAPYASPSGDIFGAQPSNDPVSGVSQLSIPPPGPVVPPAPGVTAASGVGNTKATLNAQVNPENKATTYHFEYITDEEFKAAGESFGAGTVKTTETALPGAFTFAAAELCREAAAGKESVECELRKASANLTGLAAETLYHFRVVAANADGSERTGLTASFETQDPFEFGEAWSTNVGTDSATLHGEGNPLGIAATGYFEYVDEASFEASGFDQARKAPNVDDGATPFDFGAGEAMVLRTATIFGLAPGTSYRYRLVAVNHCKADPEILCTATGPTLSFATFAPAAPPSTSCPANAAFRTGAAAFLPDCRGYEMVSPVDKLGASIEPLLSNTAFSAGFEQSSSDGNSLTYSTYKAFGDAISAPFVDQYLSRRDPATGWVTGGISPKREGPSLLTYGSNQLDRQYQGFSPDLCEAWVQQDAAPTLAPGSPPGYPGLYHRGNCGATAGQYEALSAPEPPATEPPHLSPQRFYSELQGMSADGSVALYAVSDNMTSDAPPQPPACVKDIKTEDPCYRRLYEVRDGQPRFVCVLPNGDSHPGQCTAGSSFNELWKGRGGNVANAISDDGSRIFWTAALDAGELYVRIDGVETVRISSSPSTVFRLAAGDGSKAVYSVGTKLFEFDVDSETESLIAEGFEGIAGGSDDASRLYFASTKALTGAEENEVGDKAIAGKPNLYFYEAGEGFEFIGTLADSDIASLGGPVTEIIPGRLSRVVPSGEQIAFMSAAPLTGYDNKDAATGEPVMEVYRFDATAEGASPALTCASCNPTGARPLGRQLTQKPLTSLRAAARIPGFESQLYGQRVLSDDGKRLYFNSFEGLVARDANGQEDVYQWELPGSGDCTTQSQSFAESAGGCIALISTGESTKGSELIDIGIDGNDVFFRTSSSLVPQDTGLLDLYDARVGGGFPSPPTPPAACEGEACAPPVSPPNDPTPASSAFRGPGDATTAPSAARKPCPKGKRKVRRAGKQRCVKQKPSKRKIRRQQQKQRRR